MLIWHERYPYRQEDIMTHGHFNPIASGKATHVAGGAHGTDVRAGELVAVSVEGVVGLISLVSILIISPSRASGYGERF